MKRMESIKKIKVVQSSENEIPTEVIAQAIIDMSDGLKKIRSGRLTDKALTFLIHKSSGVATATVGQVLKGIEELEKNFIKPKQERKAKRG